MMRIRLFWKILFSFWLTFICIVEGVWLIFYLYEMPRHRPREVAFVRVLAETRLGSAATVLRLGGEDGLRGLLASWPEAEQERLTFNLLIDEQVAALSGGTKADDDGMVYSTAVTLPKGGTYGLSYDGSGVMHWKKRPGPFSLPPELLILGILGGLLFSSLLAWYLMAPVWRLRMGFDQLAQGRLDVRIRELMGRRRDEIADLARDFDLMAERMQSLVESREQLLYDVSHELRSPLARQHMAIGLARQNPQRTELLLERIEQESSRMDELVGELLMLSRVESGASAFDEYFDLQGLVGVVVDNARFEAQADGVSIDLRMPSPDGPNGNFTVRGDAELVRRALDNVVRNGVRHSPRDTTLVVAVFAARDREACTIQVEDRGPGVPGESLKAIFDPFVRLDDTRRRGAGLGLAIAQRAIAVHGGSIKAANRDQGGLCITIVLPLEPPDGSEREES